MSLDIEILVLIGSVLVQIVGIFTQQSITKYRIQQLEDKVNRHNNVIERTYVLEGQMNEVRSDISEIKGKVC